MSTTLKSRNVYLQRGMRTPGPYTSLSDWLSAMLYKFYIELFSREGRIKKKKSKTKLDLIC